MQEWLDDAVGQYPPRSSGEDFYGFMIKLVGDAVAEERAALVGALTTWLRMRKEPKTMVAVEIAAVYHLHELRQEIERLLGDVKSGVSFKPYYARGIIEALARI